MKSQRRQADRSRHPADLAVFPLLEHERYPAVGNRFPNPDRRIAWEEIRPGIKSGGGAGQGAVPPNRYAGGHFGECLVSRKTFDLNPIFSSMPVSGVE